MHTRHVLRPDAEGVRAFLADGSATAHRRFAKEYLALLRERFDADRHPFDALATLASRSDVYLGCSCPSAANPDVQRCHTVLALTFMKRHYPTLRVVMPG